MNNSNNRLLQLISGKTVAVVGNGPELEDHSKEIDACDMVIRFNHMYNYESGMVGKRVDIIMQTFTSAWMRAPNKKMNEILKQRPEVFLVKQPENYTQFCHAPYGPTIRVNKAFSLFNPWSPFTTGGAALCYLANFATNTEFKVFGFPSDDRWTKYIETDAHWYKAIADNERKVVDEAKEKLASFKTDGKKISIPKIVVIPVRQGSKGCPGKNRKLLFPLLEKLKNSGYRTAVVGDDHELIADASINYGIEPFFTEYIADSTDVTNTLKVWKAASGYCGDVALVQCTSPFLTLDWIDRCFDASKSAPLVCTATPLKIKQTAIYTMGSGGVWNPLISNIAASAPRQTLQKAVRINGGVVVFHSDSIDEDSIYNAGHMCPVLVSEKESLDVDTQEDMDKVNAISSNQESPKEVK